MPSPTERRIRLYGPNGNELIVNADGSINVTAAGGSNMVQGLLAHDAVDTGEFPVFIGSRAIASRPTAVAAGDVVRAWFGLSGETIVMGDVAFDDPDSGNPVKVGGRTVANAAQGVALIASSDRTDLVTDQNGRLIGVVGGDVGHDGANNLATTVSRPVLSGGNAVANNGQQTAVSAAGDRVATAHTLNGQPKVAVFEDPINVGTGGWTYLTPTAGDANSRLIIKASAGVLRILKAINTSAGVLYLQIHNTTVVGSIATGTRAWCAYAVPANGEIEVTFELARLVLATGVAVSFSTTQLTYTAPTTAGEYSAIYA